MTGRRAWDVAALVAACEELCDPGRMVTLVATWPSRDAFIRAPLDRVCLTLGLAAEKAATLVASVSRASDARLEELERTGIGVLPSGDPAYPRNLRLTSKAPPILYVRGDAGVLSRRCVAVVGSRKCTAYGRAVAEAVAAAAAGAGLVVVSGGALGIDGAAHQAALAAGSTVAVMGCGVDLLYPPSHRGLLERIIESGCVISEFPPGTPPLPYHFPQRNRVIAGLADRVVVVEAGLKSGALHTADFAIEYDRELLVAPGPIWAPQSAGCLRLLADGATLLEDPLDVLDRFGLPGPVGGEPVFSDDEVAVLLALSEGHDGLDDLPDVTGLDTSTVLSAISALELGGAVTREPGGRLTLVRTVPAVAHLPSS